MIGRPMATRPVRDNDYLPLEPEALDHSHNTSQPSFRYFVSATSLQGVGSFGREAQAVYLYDRVRYAIENGESMANKLYHLGRDLQSLLAVVMEQLGGRWNIYCGATQVLITYVCPRCSAPLLTIWQEPIHSPPSSTLASRPQYATKLQRYDRGDA